MTPPAKTIRRRVFVPCSAISAAAAIPALAFMRSTAISPGGITMPLALLALANNSEGFYNTANGYAALYNNTADDNAANGYAALFHNTTGDNNTAGGSLALFSNTTAGLNTATGFQALYSNTTGDANMANGVGALQNNTVGTSNTANGASALFNNTEGDGNVAVGFQALLSSIANGVNTKDGANVAVGFQALQNTNGPGNSSGGGNNALGEQALQLNTTGFFNNAFGYQALQNDTTGAGNTAVGDSAGFNQTTGSGNVYIGAEMVGIAGESDTCYIKSIFGRTVAGGVPVLINSSNRLGTAVSSKRFKDEIKPMDKASEALLALKPVTFRYKKAIDPAGIPQFGLVAEDVEKVSPDLVVRDKEGKPYSVRYEQVNAMLLNEFLKEHQRVRDQQATIAQLKKEMKTIVARLKQHDSKFQEVSN